jgi:hypothetical protein
MVNWERGSFPPPPVSWNWCFGWGGGRKETKAVCSLKFYNKHQEHLEAPTMNSDSLTQIYVSLLSSKNLLTPPPPPLLHTFKAHNIPAVKSIKLAGPNIIYIVGCEQSKNVCDWMTVFGSFGSPVHPTRQNFLIYN